MCLDIDPSRRYADNNGHNETEQAESHSRRRPGETRQERLVRHIPFGRIQTAVTFTEYKRITSGKSQQTGVFREDFDFQYIKRLFYRIIIIC